MEHGRTAIIENYNRLPLTFWEYRKDGMEGYLAKKPGLSVLLTPAEAMVVQDGKKERHLVALQFVDGNASVEEVSASIAEIAGISQKTSKEAGVIAQAAEEQLAFMEQIRRSAEELEKISRELKDDLGRFVLREAA